MTTNQRKELGQWLGHAQTNATIREAFASRVEYNMAAGALRIFTRLVSDDTRNAVEEEKGDV